MALPRTQSFLLQISLNQRLVLPTFANSSNRKYSSDVKYLKSLDTAHIKRGRGGRSSFSGNVCTIFGCSGFVGRYVANLLGKCGTQMILPYRCDPDDVRHLKVMGDLGQCLFINVEMRDQDELIAKAVKHSNVVINLIGSDRFTSNWSLKQANVEVAEKIARISKEMGVEKFIHMSSLNCDRPHEGYFQPGGSEFLKTKFESEQAVRSVFPEAMIFRPSDIYGQEDRFIRYYTQWWRSDFRKLGLVNSGYGIYKQPLYVGDLALAIQNIVHRDAGEPGETYQAAGPHRYEMHDLIDWFLRLQRRKEDALQHCYTDIVDLKYLPLQRLKAWANPFFWKSSARIHTWEKYEREAISDEVDPDLPTLVDLGVELTTMESRIHWEIAKYKYHMEFAYQMQSNNDCNAHYTIPE